MRLRAQKGRCGGFGLYEGKLFMTTKQVVYMLLAMLVAAAVSFAATPLVKTLACKVGAIDVPKDNRRMHKVPIPRMGDRKSTRLNSSHSGESRMPSSA